EIGMEGGEGIVGDLRLGSRHGGEESGFARVGEADEAGVGDQLQPQPYPFLGALLAGIGVARRLVRRSLEMGVAEAAIAASEQGHALADMGQVGDQGFVVVLEDLGADRNAHDDVRRIGAMPVLAHAVATGLGLEMLLVTVVDEGVQRVDALDHDVAAAASVAAVRPAELEEFLAQEADGAGPAVSGADIDLGLIEEFHVLSLPVAPSTRGAGIGACRARAASAQSLRLSSVSIWRTSSPRARQCRVL